MDQLSWSNYDFTKIPFDRIVKVGQRTMLYRDMFVVSWILGSVIHQATKWNLVDVELGIVTSNCHCHSRTARLEEVVQESIDVHLDLSPVNTLHLVVKVES